MDRPTHGYAGYCPKCGTLCVMELDYMDKRTGEFVAKFIEGGLVVQREPIDAMYAKWGMSTCTCDLETKGAALAGAICHWTYDAYDDYWESECEEALVFMDGGPAENNMRYCPYCGNRLAEIAPPTDDEEEGQ
jgi:hypothetical protein